MLKKEKNRARNKSLNYGRDRTSELIEEGLLSKRHEARRSGSYKTKPRSSSKHLKSKQSQPRRMLDKMLKRMSKNSIANCKKIILKIFFSKKNQKFDLKALLSQRKESATKPLSFN